MAKDAEAAHVASGGDPKEKPTYDETKPLGKVEAWLERCKDSKFGQNAWVRGECLGLAWLEVFGLSSVCHVCIEVNNKYTGWV